MGQVGTPFVHLSICQTTPGHQLCAGPVGHLHSWAHTAIQAVHCTSHIIVLFSPEQQLWPFSPLTLGNVLGQQILETDRCSSLLQVPWGSASIDTFIFPRKSIDNSSVALEAMWLGHMTLLGTRICRKLVCSCQTLHLASLSVS